MKQINKTYETQAKEQNLQTSSAVEKPAKKLNLELFKNLGNYYRALIGAAGLSLMIGLSGCGEVISFGFCEYMTHRLHTRKIEYFVKQAQGGFGQGGDEYSSYSHALIRPEILQSESRFDVNYQARINHIKIVKERGEDGREYWVLKKQPDVLAPKVGAICNDRGMVYLTTVQMGVLGFRGGPNGVVLGKVPVDSPEGRVVSELVAERLRDNSVRKMLEYLPIADILTYNIEVYHLTFKDYITPLHPYLMENGVIPLGTLREFYANIMDNPKIEIKSHAMKVHIPITEPIKPYTKYMNLSLKAIKAGAFSCCYYVSEGEIAFYMDITAPHEVIDQKIGKDPNSPDSWSSAIIGSVFDRGSPRQPPLIPYEINVTMQIR